MTIDTGGLQLHAKWLQASSLQRLFDAIERGGGTAKVVGGAVRNQLLGVPVLDVDLATELLPETLISALESCEIKAVPTGIEHGTVTAVVDHTAYEVTTLRSDIETDGRHARVKFGTDWSKDAERRDFTINAIYCDRSGKLFDPVGGLEDLREKNIRFIGDAVTRIREDALRILRFFRFFAWYGDGRPNAEGLKACAAERKLVTALSVERIWQEFRKLLSAPDPVRAMLWMRTSGILSLILPESEKWGIDALPGLIRAERSAGLDPDPMRRLMACIPDEAPRLATLADRLSMSGQEKQRLLDWAEGPALTQVLDEVGLKELIYRGSRQGLKDRCLLNIANSYPGSDLEVKYLKLLHVLTTWSKPEFPVKGADLFPLGFEQGPKLGGALRQLEERWIASDFSLGKDALLKEIES